MLESDDLRLQKLQEFDVRVITAMHFSITFVTIDILFPPSTNTKKPKLVR